MAVKTKRVATNQLTPQQKIVEQLIVLMQAGTLPWRRDWDVTNGHHCNLFSGHRYQGNNPILLELALMVKPTLYPYWCGFNEAKSHGLTIKKGSKASYILRPNPVSKEVENDDGELVETKFMFYKPIALFHVSDLDGDGIEELIAFRQKQSGIKARPEHERHEQAEQLFNQWDVPVHWGGDRACYRPVADCIHLPERQQFHSSASLYATWAHEIIHSTGHASRLNRPLSGDMNSSSYAEEELIAELGSVLLGQRLEIGSSITNHASYLQAWIQRLEQEPKFLFQALSQAKKAVDLICPDTLDPMS